MSDSGPKMPSREKWQSRLGFIFAAAGWSVGLGNIWRFPYVTGENGGGAFLLIYLLGLFFVAIPMFTVEFSLGRESGSSITTGYRRLSERKAWSLGGWVGIIATILIAAYYTMLMAWVVAYLSKTVRGAYFSLTPEQIGSQFDQYLSLIHI